MKVLLKEDVDNLGFAGEVMEVAAGYGRNYLIPRGLAVKATPGVLRQAKSWRDRASIRMNELRKEHEALAGRISATHLVFTARAGEAGKLYGSVTSADITDQLNEVLGTEIERKYVIGGPLRQLGEHSVTVRLSRDYSPQLAVRIKPFVEEEKAEIEEATEAEEIVSEVEDEIVDEIVDDGEEEELEAA